MLFCAHHTSRTNHRGVTVSTKAISCQCVSYPRVFSYHWVCRMIRQELMIDMEVQDVFRGQYFMGMDPCKSSVQRQATNLEGFAKKQLKQ